MKNRDGLKYLAQDLATDDRILSAPEKDLIGRLLKHAQSADGCADAVTETIARAVGEIVTDRAQLVLGKNLVEMLLEQSFGTSTPPRPLPDPPRPPGPNPPGTFAGRQNAGTASPPMIPPGPTDPNPPRPPGPNPPGSSFKFATSRESAGVAVAEPDEMPEFLTADFVVLDEFLAPAELHALTQYALQKEAAYQISEVLSPGVPGGKVDYESRRSRVLMDLGPHYDIIVDRLRSALPGVLRKIGHESFEIKRVEAQITASNDGDYFHWHCDNGLGEIAGREITFVYFFHREPKPFRGGELRIYDSRLENGSYRPAEHYRTVAPEQNQAVLFFSSLTHEITPVETPSREFADSRFTVNGWFHK